MKNILSTLSAFLLSAFFLSDIVVAQTTLIPDTNFEQALIDLGHDNSLDGSIQTGIINGITHLDVSSKSISNLTGIEDFTSLKTLYCNDNEITSLSLSSNLALKDLRCNNNQLTSLNLSSNDSMDAINCSNNKLSSLTLSSSPALTYLNCERNQLISLVVDNKNLSTLICRNNPLLKTLYCNDNEITSLFLSSNLALKDLRCNNNQLTSLNLSSNDSIDAINCSNNKLSSLTLSSSSALTYLNCEINQLTSLDLRNGNNSNINFFSATNNPSLLCIDVDDVAWANANWSDGIDAQSNFSTDCSTTGINNLSLSKVFLYPNPTTGNITIDLNETKTDVHTTLFNSFGQTVFRQQFEKSSFININMEVPEGIYFLQLRTADDITKIVKILKE